MFSFKCCSWQTFFRLKYLDIKLLVYTNVFFLHSLLPWEKMYPYLNYYYAFSIMKQWGMIQGRGCFLLIMTTAKYLKCIQGQFLLVHFITVWVCVCYPLGLLYCSLCWHYSGLSCPLTASLKCGCEFFNRNLRWQHTTNWHISGESMGTYVRRSFLYETAVKK